MRRAADHQAAVRRMPLGAVGVAVCGGLVVAVLTACSAVPAAPSASPGATVPVSPSATSAAAPAIVPDGTASDNLPLFRRVVETVWATPEKASGEAYIDALTAAGFDRTAMQVTEDDTTIGQPAESIQFSVAWRDGCLVGQVGPATGDPVVTVLPRLAGGGCFIGRTRPIDG